jgi:hypothetical protein
MSKVKQKKSNHLLDANKGYLEHLSGALKTSGECFFAGTTAFLHGFIPFLFKTSASDTVKKIYKRQNPSD